MLIRFMSGAPADGGLYKGVIYKTNEKSNRFVDIRGVFYEREERETGEARQPHFLRREYESRGSSPPTIEQTRWEGVERISVVGSLSHRTTHERLQT